MEVQLSELKITYNRFFRQAPTKDTVLHLVKKSHSLNKEEPLISVIAGGNTIKLFYKEAEVTEFCGADFKDATKQLFESEAFFSLIGRANKELKKGTMKK